MGDDMTDSDTDNSDNTTDSNSANTAGSTKKGRVRRVSKKQQPSESNTDNDTGNHEAGSHETGNHETGSNAVDTHAVNTEADDAQTGDTANTHQVADGDVLQARVERVATGILDSVLGQTGVTDTASMTEPAVHASNTNPKPINRRELAAAKARQMRLNSAREFLRTGKLINAKQRLFDILESAPDSTEADTALELLLELAAHYETIGQTRWALDLYDDIARYG